MTEDTIVEAVETYERKKAKQDEFEQKVKHAIGHSTEQAQKPSVRQAYQMMGDEESATFALELLRLVKEE